MQNKFREFWIELEEKGARAFVYTEPVDGLNDDSIHTVEYAAIESANDKIAKLKEEVRQLDYHNSVLSKDRNCLQESFEYHKEEIEKLKEQNSGLIEALEHIASPKHWAIDTFVPEIRDRVKIARDALKKWGEV